MLLIRLAAGARGLIKNKHLLRKSAPKYAELLSWSCARVTVAIARVHGERVCVRASERERVNKREDANLSALC